MGGVRSASDQRKQYWDRKLNNQCVSCGAGLLEECGVRCLECAESSAAYRRRNYKRNAPKLREISRLRAADSYRANPSRKLEAMRTRYRERRLNGICTRCTERVVDGHSMCAPHLEADRAQRERSRIREVRGPEASPIRKPGAKRKALKSPRINHGIKEASKYTPVDELMVVPVNRLLKAMRWMDWERAQTILDATGAEDDCYSTERNTLQQALGRLVAEGLVDRRMELEGKRTLYEYTLTDAGRRRAADISRGLIAPRLGAEQRAA